MGIYTCIIIPKEVGVQVVFIVSYVQTLQLTGRYIIIMFEVLQVFEQEC